MKHVMIAQNWYEQSIYEGVAAYAADNGWLLNSDVLRRAGRIRGAWTGDGIIANFAGDHSFRDRMISFGCPIVTVNTNVDDPEYPSVSADMDKAVSMAFEYFRRKGFRYFGCYGANASDRIAKFRDHAETNGFPCDTLYWHVDKLRDEVARIKDWLSSHSLPMAVYCNNDDEAGVFINLAEKAGYQVPSDVAVLGTDNWELACMRPRVRLSSIDLNLFEVGLQAAKKLAQIMEGGPEPSLQTFIDPKGIVERASTDAFGVTSPKVREAIAIMERDYDKGISVADLVADLNVSYSSLEKAFKSELGYTLATALRNVRMKVASSLLVTTDEKVQTISKMVGMNNKEYFQTLFKKHFGITPRKYRLKAKSQ